MSLDDVSLQEVRSVTPSIIGASGPQSLGSDSPRIHGIGQGIDVQPQQPTLRSARGCNQSQTSAYETGQPRNIKPRQSALGTAAGTDHDRNLGVARRTERSFTMNLLIHMGWWWELASALLSLSFMSLIVAILFFMDGRSYEKWKLPIQPNSLVSVFSTISKSSLLYPLAECIGQLKWEYFDTARPRALSELHAFDAASRGPWGAFQFIWLTRGRAILATIGSFIMVLMLAFEPFAQQILLLSTRNVLLHNETASVVVTNVWYVPDNTNKGGVNGEYDKGKSELAANIKHHLLQ
jgi:hypothetical protein